MARMGIAELVGSAQALAATGQAALAAELYRDWVALNPDDPLLHAAEFNRGVLLAALGGYAWRGRGLHRRHPAPAGFPAALHQPGRGL